MALTDPFSSLAGLPFGQLFESLLPDFILSFAFFTALAYAILGVRFGHQRPAIVMSGALGLALAAGLTWWEHQHGWSIRNLGPVAVGFAVILLGSVMFQGIRQTGGTWAGTAIALGASVLVASSLGAGWFGASGILNAAATLALIVGIVAFVLHVHNKNTRVHPVPAADIPEVKEVRHDMSDLYEDRHVEGRLHEGLGRIRYEAHDLPRHPQDASHVMGQLQRMLPAEGWLTERLAHLRERAYLVRRGHAQKLEEMKDFFEKLPPTARKKIAGDLITRYQEIVGIDLRLERLDGAVAENERRVRDLTAEAQGALARYDYAKLNELLADAQKLQDHNSKLFKLIDRSEHKLEDIIKRVADEARQVSQD
jgi:hypothetical protein